MSSFLTPLPRSTRTWLGVVGVLSVLGLWTLLTWPFFVERSTDREAVVDAAGEPTGKYIETVRETRRALVNPPALESPMRTFAKAAEVDLPRHVWASSKRILLGFFLSILLAVPLGVAMGLFPRFYALASPLISFLRPIPSICWVPLAVIWFGVDLGQKLAIIFMGSFAATLLYTIEATRRVDANLLYAAKNLGASNRQLLWRVLLPAALPNILSGLKVVLAICWTCVISAEIVGTQLGLGSLVWQGMEKSQTATVLVGIVSIGSIVFVMDRAFTLIERALLPHLHTGEERA